MPNVVRINVTPVKSTALNHPQEVRLEAPGPVDDRRFFLVDDAGEWFGGDAVAPLMLIRSSYDADLDELELEMPDGQVVTGSAAATGEAITVHYVGEPVPAHVVDGDWSRPLADFAGRPMRLAKLDVPGTLVDEPVTIVSLASVQDLGRRGGRDALDTTRFRMTFDLGDCEPHEEDGWSDERIAIGRAELQVTGPVGRCVITTLDQDTGKQDFPTLKLIAAYREPIKGVDAPFGLFAKVTRPGTVRVGDPVERRTFTR